jgi:hypothetical protein
VREAVRFELFTSETGVIGRGLAVLIEGRGGFCASEEVDRLNGFFSTGYAWSKGGTGGVSYVVFPVLNAFRSEAKDVFFTNGEADVLWGGSLVTED